MQPKPIADTSGPLRPSFVFHVLPLPRRIRHRTHNPETRARRCLASLVPEIPDR
jgi:hypothetical protein